MQAASNILADSLAGSGSDVSNKPKTMPGKSMKALCWYGTRDVRVCEVAVPDVTDPEDVILEVTLSSHCGSDNHIYTGNLLNMTPGDILGHECIGRIIAKGPKVKNFEIGQRVIVPFNVACGDCWYCKQDLTSACEGTNDSSLAKHMWGAEMSAFPGYSGLCHGLSGGQAEYFRAPHADFNLQAIPDDVTDEQALYLTDAACTAWHCVKDTGVPKSGDCVAVWGAGPIGLYCALFAFIKGARRVVLIDPVQYRLDFAKEHISKIEVLNPGTHKVQDELRKMEARGFDVCIDATSFHEPQTLLHKTMQKTMLETDSPEVPNQCILATRKFGTVKLISVFSLFTNGFNIGALMEKGIRFIGCGQCPVRSVRDELMDMIKSKKFDPTFVMTHRLPIDDLAELYRIAGQHRVPGLLKTAVTTRFSVPPSAGCPKETRIKDWPIEPMSLSETVSDAVGGAIATAGNLVNSTLESARSLVK